MGLYNYGRLPQDSAVSSFETSTASTWPQSSGSTIFDLSTDAWQHQYNQPYQQSPRGQERAPLLTLQTPDAGFPTVVPHIYSPQLPWDLSQNNVQNIEAAEYDPSMPVPDNYPSPNSEGSGVHRHSKDRSHEPGPVVMNTGNPDETSPSSVGSVGRPRLSLKRDQEPPRNEVGQITCVHQECSRSTPPTFQRKCEWRSVFALLHPTVKEGI